jgi:hypothetical protein
MIRAKDNKGKIEISGRRAVRIREMTSGNGQGEKKVTPNQPAGDDARGGCGLL